MIIAVPLPVWVPVSTVTVPALRLLPDEALPDWMVTAEVEADVELGVLMVMPPKPWTTKAPAEVDQVAAAPLVRVRAFEPLLCTVSAPDDEGWMVLPIVTPF